MTTTQIVLLIVLLVAIVIFMYVVLPRIGDAHSKSGKLVRLGIFSALVLYLGYEFYTKAKYGMLVVLLLGAVAFVVALLGAGKKKQ